MGPEARDPKIGTWDLYRIWERRPERRQVGSGIQDLYHMWDPRPGTIISINRKQSLFSQIIACCFPAEKSTFRFLWFWNRSLSWKRLQNFKLGKRLTVRINTVWVEAQLNPIYWSLKERFLSAAIYTSFLSCSRLIIAENEHMCFLQFFELKDQEFVDFRGCWVCRVFYLVFYVTSCRLIVESSYKIMFDFKSVNIFLNLH